uniref:1,5-anhydro-D-fructose reductase n=1 Tax=Pristiophorus japonicus TaxID=55135 RepID=UPI00398F194D
MPLSPGPEADADRFVLVASLDNARNLSNLLKAVHFRDQVTVFASANGIRVTAEAAKSVQGNAFIQLRFCRAPGQGSGPGSEASSRNLTFTVGVSALLLFDEKSQCLRRLLQQSEPGVVGEAVSAAIDAGYRHIDGAYSYQNETEVGAAVKRKIDEGVVTRENLFIVSKLWCTFHAPVDVKPSLMETLSALQLTYLDLYLIHFPVGFQKVLGELFPVRDNNMLVSEIDYVDTWKAMEALVDEGLVKSIGVSNFNVSQLQRLLSVARIIPAVNQVELHPYLTQPELVEFCSSRDITVTAFSPLGSPGRIQSKVNDSADPKDLLKDPVVKVIAEKHRKSPAQVLLRFHVQRNIATIPKSVSPARIRENAEIFDFELMEEDLQSLLALNKNWRVCQLNMLQGHRFYPFKDS